MAEQLLEAIRDQLMRRRKSMTSVARFVSEQSLSLKITSKLCNEMCGIARLLVTIGLSNVV